MLLKTSVFLAAILAAVCVCDANAQDVDDSDYRYWCTPKARGGALCGRITGSDDNYSVPGSQIDHAGFATDNKSFFIECPASGKSYSLTSRRFVQVETNGQVVQNGQTCCRYTFVQKKTAGVWCPGAQPLVL